MLDHKLYTYLKVVELKSYTKAAEALNLTQPAVTQHIKKLEEFYDARFIEVKGRSLHLTEQGRLLYSYANYQMANEEQLRAQMRKMDIPLKVGATLSIADYYLPGYLSAYLDQSDSLLSITVKNTESIIEMLLKNELYCAFIEGIFDTSLFHYKEFVTTRFMPVARTGHPLAGRKVEMSEILNFPLILREKGSGTREIFENYLYEHNESLLSASRVYEVSSFGILKKLIQHSDAITFMYEGVPRREIEERELTFLDIKDYEIRRPLYFIYPNHSLMKERNEEFFRTLMQTGQDQIVF